jgi:hypothetical protein
MGKESLLFRSKPFRLLAWINRPSIQNISRQRRVNMHATVVLERNQVFVEESVDMWGQQHAVVAIESFGIVRGAPGFDV